MSYCTDCGTELSDDVAYCPDCGTPVDTSQPETDEPAGDVDDGTADLDGAYIEEEGEKTSWSVVVAAAIIGLLPGFLLWWGFGTIGGGGLVFLIGWVGTTVYLRNKRLVSEVIGSGLYIVALLLPLVPILFYVPVVARDAETVGETGAQIGGFIGLFVYAIIFAIVGAVVAGIGYLAKKRAATKLDAA